MLILLPPSETKISGGEGELTLASLGFPGLASGRSAAISAVRELVAAGQDESTPAKQRAAQANASLESSPVMPAIERYTGVLYDGLSFGTLDDLGRTWVGDHVAIGSALFGLLRASDSIPDYKVSHGTRVPGTTFARIWKSVPPLTAAALADDSLVIDMRSKAYAAQLPVEGAVSFDVVDERGKALSHWNKHAKGAFVRMLAEARAEPGDIESLLRAARGAGADVSMRDGELLLLDRR